MSDTSKVYKLLSVNSSPERAFRLVGETLHRVGSQYQIVHCGNAAHIDDVEGLVLKHRPDILFCASMWSPAESDQIKAIGRSIVPDLRCYAVPQGLRAEKGEQGVVDHVASMIPKIVDGDVGLA